MKLHLLITTQNKKTNKLPIRIIYLVTDDLFGISLKNINYSFRVFCCGFANVHWYSGIRLVQKD